MNYSVQLKALQNETLTKTAIYLLQKISEPLIVFFLHTALFFLIILDV